MMLGEGVTPHSSVFFLEKIIKNIDFSWVTQIVDILAPKFIFSEKGANAINSPRYADKIPPQCDSNRLPCDNNRRVELLEPILKSMAGARRHG